jgi:hypothetical protein
MTDGARDWDTICSAALSVVNEILDDIPLAERVTDAILNLLNEEAVDRLAAEFIADTKLKGMDFRDGGRMEMEPAREVVALWVGAGRGLLDGAENYAEIEMPFKVADDWQRYAFTCQTVGKLTPHQDRKMAEVERDRLAAENTELRNQLSRQVITSPWNEPEVADG